MYLDTDFASVIQFVDIHIYTTLEGILKNDSIKDYKTLAQELAQCKYNLTPSYQVLNEK
jgi:dsRNA-specific ribonuclease